MGDEQRERFEAVFDQHYDVVLRFTLARAEPEAAKDAAAETFLAAWRAMDSLPAEPRGWLITVARRKLADHYRAAGRRDLLHASLALSTPPASPDPADSVAETDRVRAALFTLPERDQEILRLLAWDGLTRIEAAQVLGCSTALFAVRLHRARRRLRDCLEAQEPVPEVFAHLRLTEPTLIAEERSC